MIDTDARSLRVNVFNKLEEEILNGKYGQGDSLTELKISKELGVSRTPVREALMQLELEGLVENIPNKGAIVVGISEKDIEDIYAIRLRIEGLASHLCAENISEEEKKALIHILELQEFYLMKKDVEQIWKLDSDFHDIIYDGSGSRPLRYMLSNFHNYIKRARDVSMKAEGRAQKAVEEHKAMLDAILAGDAERAEELTKNHILKAKENLLAQTTDREMHN